MTSDDDRFSGSMAALLAGRSLDLDARAQIVARGDAIVPRLLDVLQDRRLAEADAPGDGYAPLHAAELLAEIRATDAIAPMLALFAALDHDDMLFETIAVVLSDFGAAVVEPVLAAHDATEDPELRDYYCEMLAKCGERDERIFPRLLEAYERIPEFGTGLLGSYGDPAGLPWVQREFERVADASDNEGISALLGAEEALASLDALTPEHEDIVARARQRVLELRGKPLRPLVPAARVMPARRRERPGRNEPCWCGSGKKYKRCHADADDRDERSALDEELAGEDAELAQALIDLGGDELDDFVEGEEEARQRLVDLLMIAWNIASFEEIGNERGPQQLRAELDRADDSDTLHEYVDDLIELRREEWPEDTRFVMSARVVEDTLVVESGEHDPGAKPTLH